jgi:hypothetical protein
VKNKVWDDSVMPKTLGRLLHDNHAGVVNFYPTQEEAGKEAWYVMTNVMNFKNVPPLLDFLHLLETERDKLARLMRKMSERRGKISSALQQYAWRHFGVIGDDPDKTLDRMEAHRQFCCKCSVPSLCVS